MGEVMMDRLFVPLNTGPYEDFKSDRKTYELRSYGRVFTEKHVYSGRKVELRKGYSGESQWGVIGDVILGSLEDVLNKVSYKKIIPKATTKKEAVQTINQTLGIKEKYIAFEVKK